MNANPNSEWNRQGRQEELGAESGMEPQVNASKRNRGSVESVDRNPISIFTSLISESDRKAMRRAEIQLVQSE